MNKSKSPLFTTHSIALMGLLLAAEIVLSRFCSIATWNIKIGFTFIPLVLSAGLFGPIGAGVLAALADFFGRYLIPHWPLLPRLYLYPVLRRRCVWSAAAKKTEHGTYRRRSFAHTDIEQSAVGFVLDLRALR